MNHFKLKLTVLTWTAVLMQDAASQVLPQLNSLPDVYVNSTDQCAKLVPPGHVALGKGAFYSGCDTLQAQNQPIPPGCWASNPNTNYANGCQTCVIQDATWNSSFYKNVRAEFHNMEDCPTTYSYADTYLTGPGAFYPDLAVVKYSDLYNPDECPDTEDPDVPGTTLKWFYWEAGQRCYYKADEQKPIKWWDGATARCKALSANQIAMETEEENNFLVYTLLWIGFHGETFVGLRKNDATNWYWQASTENFTKDSFQDWYASSPSPPFGYYSTYTGGYPSCAEIYPYLPKGWNAFDCFINKFYTCEKASASGSDGGLMVASTPAPGPIPLTTVALAPYTPAAQASFLGFTAAQAISAAAGQPWPGYSNGSTASSSSSPSGSPSPASPTAAGGAPTSPSTPTTAAAPTSGTPGTGTAQSTSGAQGAAPGFLLAVAAALATFVVGTRL